MARAKLNPLFASTSGKIGEIVVVERQGKFFVRKLRTRPTPPRPKELERREVFRQAAVSGKTVFGDSRRVVVFAQEFTADSLATCEPAGSYPVAD